MGHLRVVGGRILPCRALSFSGANANRGIAILGYDASNQTFLAQYFDNEGTSDIYRVDVQDGVLEIAWELYRFEGAFSADGNTITGTWEQSSDGSNWDYWYDLEMTKVK